MSFSPIPELFQAAETVAVIRCDEVSPPQLNAVVSVPVDQESLPAGKKNRRGSDASTRGRKPGKKRGKRSLKRTMSMRKSEDNDDDATEIEDNGDDDEEEFVWPLHRNPNLIRDLPPVSQSHVDLINRFRDKEIITEKEVYDVMMKLDFDLFYHNAKDEWIEHNAVIIERTIPFLKPGSRVLLLPLNLYYAVILAILVDDGGGVVSFGHYGNVHTLNKIGLNWMLEDYRLRFTNNRYELFYGKPAYPEYIKQGFPRGGPYDLIIMTDNLVSETIKRQLKDDGIIIRPDIEDYVIHPSHMILNRTENTEPTEPVKSDPADCKPKSE